MRPAGTIHAFPTTHAGLADKRTFKRFIAPLRRIQWVVYCKAPFAGPEQVLRYLSRYTHRVAISNRRLVAADDEAIAFRWKDYRVNGPGRWKTMPCNMILTYRPKALGAVLGPDAGEGEQWPILIQREPDDILLGLRVRLRRIFSEAVGRDQASVLRL
jgi:hypothetical protein